VVLYLFCKNILHALAKVSKAHKLAKGLESVTSDRESGKVDKRKWSAGGNDLGSQFFIIVLKRPAIRVNVIMEAKACRDRPILNMRIRDRHAFHYTTTLND